MAFAETVAEVSGDRRQLIPRSTIPLQYVTTREIHKLTTQETLHGPYVRQSIIPNRVFLMRCAEAPWMFFVPVNGYTLGDQLTSLRWDDEVYMPGPERLSAEEGEALMFVWGNIASAMMDDQRNEIVSVGYNWSPRSFGQSGYQTIPRQHIQGFGLLRISDLQGGSVELLERKELPKPVKASIVGGFHNIQLGRILMHHVTNGDFEGEKTVFYSLVDTEEAKIGFRGISFPLRRRLDDTLRSAGIHKDVILPLARILNQTAVDMSVAFTDLDPAGFDKQAELAMTTPSMPVEQREAILAFLTRTPSFLTRDKRLKNINGLKGKYPEEVIAYMRDRVDKRLPEDSEPATHWKNGFGYALAMRWDRRTGRSSLVIFSAVTNGPGGVMEGTEGILLNRPPDPFPEKEMVLRRESFRRLIGAALNNRNGYHRVARLEEVYI
ncbi:hypothetical protein HYT18_01490 [Candidatus Microgenomates bacterium]|nr:hypothetical protein [Candidatus Microgenomates bacterium]